MATTVSAVNVVGVGGAVGGGSLAVVVVVSGGAAVVVVFCGAVVVVVSGGATVVSGGAGRGAAVSTGAVVGGAVDAGLGGTSLMLGGMVGAVVGGAAALWGGDQLAQTQVLSLPLGGKEVVCGPVKDRNFPYVALARAITHWRLVGGRSHADRSTLKVADGAGFDWSERTSTLERAQLERTFTRLRRAPDDTKSIEALVAYVRRLGPGE
ncbi:MAG: DUF3482 domain-containing protein [Pseudomonadota bacterium]